jgi:hypothetical protein
MTPEEKAAFIDNLPKILDDIAKDIFALKRVAHIHTRLGVVEVPFERRPQDRRRRPGL